MPAFVRFAVGRTCAVLLVAFSAVTISKGTHGQTLPASPPQTTSAVTLTTFQQKVLRAFTPSGLTFSTLTLVGTVDRTAGSTKESGTITLHSSSDGSSRETWSGAGNNREISCASWADAHTCSMTQGGTTKDLEGASSQRSVSWFAPWAGMSAFGNLVSAATETTDSLGDEVLTFVPAYGSVAGLPLAKQKRLEQMTKAASVSVLYDATTGLPSGMHYTEPLSTETSNAIDVSIVYSDYRLEQGFMVPHHIQRYIQRTLESDIHITSVSLS